MTLAIAGTSLAFLALIAEGMTAAWLALCALAVAAAIRRDVAAQPWALCGLGWAIVALIEPQIFRADFTGYYAYARSALFDGDLDFSNEMEVWGRQVEHRTSTGMAYNQYTPGPALVWTPFIVVAHVYVLLGRALGLVTHAADGYGMPYVRAAAAGTVAVAAAGAWALAATLRTRHAGSVSWLAVAGAVLTSPVLFYVFVHPGMAHGIAFGLAAALLAATEAARAGPSRRRWIVVGLVLGFLATVRLQAAVLAILPVIIGVEALWRRRVPFRWLAAGALASLGAFLPQMVAWRILYGSFFRVPEGPGLGQWGGGRGWFDPTSPRWLDVLIHADHGLLTWTPFALVGIVGLVFALRRWTILAAAGLLALALTTYVNGCLEDWAGSDAFGARRFDVIVPFLAMGLAMVLDAMRARPLVAPALLMAIAVAWNVGLARLYKIGGFTDAVPVEDAAQRQAGQLRRGLESIAEGLGGERGRSLAYKALVGRYFYWNLNLSGTIDLAHSDALLVGDWSRPQNRVGGATFRWALFPRSCLRIPLEDPSSSALRGVVTARAPGRLEPQPMTVRWNDAVVASASLTREWQDVPFVLTPETSKPGENILCFEFTRGLPGGDGEAAAISRVQLP